MFLANFPKYAVTLGGCHFCIFVCILTLTSNLLAYCSEWFIFLMMYNYALLLVTKAYLIFLYATFKRESTVVTLVNL